MKLKTTYDVDQTDFSLIPELPDDIGTWIDEKPYGACTVFLPTASKNEVWLLYIL